MRFETIRALVGHVPYIQPDNARLLYDLILRECCEDILELGVAHGTATCFMAAALNARGRGRIVSVDLLDAAFSPSPEQQLAEAGLAHHAQVRRTKSGYSWFLHDEIRRCTVDGRCVPAYDLCVIDGPKSWIIDGGAFFLVDKLLRDGGWIIFDDYHWTHAAASQRRAVSETSREAWSDEEWNTPQIREVFELLVEQHPGYDEFRWTRWGWGMARKRAGVDASKESEVAKLRSLLIEGEPRRGLEVRGVGASAAVGLGSIVDELYVVRDVMNRGEVESYGGPVDVVLLDGESRHPWPCADLLALLPVLSPGGWVVLPDVRPSAENGAAHLFREWPYDKRRWRDVHLGAIRLPEDVAPLPRRLRNLVAQRPWDRSFPPERRSAQGLRAPNGQPARAAAAARAYARVEVVSREGRPVFVWGTGAGGRLLFEGLQRQQLPVAGFIESDASRQGWSIAGLIAREPRQVLETKAARPFVVAGGSYVQEIAQQLERFGWMRDADYVLF